MSSERKCRGEQVTSAFLSSCRVRQPTNRWQPSEYRYWNTNPPSVWNVVGYLKSTPAANSLDAYNIAIDSYLKELEGIADSDDQWSVKHKKKACSLLKGYRQVREPWKAEKRGEAA